MLDIKNDIVFQYVMGQEESKELLKETIQLFVPFKIQSLEVINPRVRQGYLEEKQTVMDVLCKTNTGTYIQVEMQMDNVVGSLGDRLEYYNAQLLCSQKMKGKEYWKLDACYTIMIMNFNYYEDSRLVHHFKMQDEQQVVANRNAKKHIITIELPKCKEGASSAQEQLSYYLRYYADEKKHDIIKALEKGNKICAMVEKRMSNISESERKRLEEMLHEMYLNDMVSKKAYMMKQAKEEGLAQGLREGLEQGRSEGLVQGRSEGLEQGKEAKEKEIILTMSEQLSTQEIAKYLDLDVKEVERILNK